MGFAKSLFLVCSVVSIFQSLPSESSRPVTVLNIANIETLVEDMTDGTIVLFNDMESWKMIKFNIFVCKMSVI